MLLKPHQSDALIIELIGNIAPASTKVDIRQRLTWGVKALNEKMPFYKSCGFFHHVGGTHPGLKLRYSSKEASSLPST